MKKVFSKKNLTDEQLVKLLNEGDEIAFGLIYDRYAERMLSFFYSKLQDREKAEDFLQNLFIKLIEKGRSFDSNRIFKTWFYTLAHNQCKNEYRRKSRAPKQEDNIELNSLVNNCNNWEESLEEMDSSIFSEHLAFALNRQGNNHQSTFILRFKYSFSIKEISEVLDCSEGTTKSRLFYTLKKLATELQEFNPY